MLYHYVVSPSLWNDDPALYRRHRLSLFLTQLETTSKVIWAAPKYGDFSSLIKKPVQGQLKNEIVEMGVPDFKSLTSHLELLQGNLRSNIQDLHRNNKFILWFTTPVFSSLAKLDLWDAIIYDCSDMWTEAKHLKKIKKMMISRTEREIIRSADLCFASSQILKERLFHAGRSDTILLENGVDFQHFKNVKYDETVNQSKKKPVLGFVGGLKPWKIDFDLLIEIAKAKPDWELVLVGAEYEPMTPAYHELIRLPNVTKHDSVPIEEIPKYIQTFDVGLLPYQENEYNRGVFPLKFFEYLACGVPVVGCGLPSTLHYEEEQVFEHVPAETERFLAACERAIHSRQTKIERRQSIAQAADWDEKFTIMWDKVQSIVE